MVNNSNISYGSVSKGKKITAILLILVLVAGLAAGTILAFSDSAEVAKCTSETVVKVVDAVGRSYCDFSGQIKDSDKGFTADNGAICIQDLGLAEGKYTLVITQINGREADVSREIEVVSDANENTETDNVENSCVDELSIATEEPMTDADRYRPLLKKYVEAIEEDWTAQQWKEAGLSFLIGQLCHDYKFLSGTSDVGYYIRDIDQNGREELLVYSTENPYVIYAAYCIKDDEVTCLFTANNIGTAWCYCGENHVFYGDDYCTNYCKIENETVVYLEALIWECDETYWWVLPARGVHDAKQEVSLDEYLSIEAQYPITELEGQPLSAMAR